MYTVLVSGGRRMLLPASYLFLSEILCIDPSPSSSIAVCLRLFLLISISSLLTLGAYVRSYILFFKLHVHRTESVRDPIKREQNPIFPLWKKYWRANYTLEGLESAESGGKDDTNIPDYLEIRPDPDEAVEAGKAE